MNDKEYVTRALRTWSKSSAEWMANYGDHAASVARRASSNAYTADQAANDLASCTMLAAKGFGVWASTAFDVLAACTKLDDSQPFATFEPAVSERPLKVEILEIVGEAWGSKIDIGSVTVLPSILQTKGETECSVFVASTPDANKYSVAYRVTHQGKNRESKFKVDYPPFQ